jgi:hypothetical protein
VFGTRREEVKGGRRQLYSERLHKLPSSPYITGQIKQDETGREWGPNENKSNAYNMREKKLKVRD